MVARSVCGWIQFQTLFNIIHVFPFNRKMRAVIQRIPPDIRSPICTDRIEKALHYRASWEARLLIFVIG